LRLLRDAASRRARPEITLPTARCLRFGGGLHVIPAAPRHWLFMQMALHTQAMTVA